MQAMYIRSETIPRQPLLLCPVGRIVALCINRILCGKVLPIMTGSPPASTKVSASAATRSQAPLLDAKTVDKRFGDFVANDAVSFSIYPGEIHALLGENGAGKSTLLNCLIGKLIPDTGSVMFDGQSVLGRTPYEINQLGISRVFQTPEIFGDLTVFENMMIPIFAKRDGAFALDAISDFMSHKDVVEQAENELEEMNMADKRHMHAASLSRGDKRRLEIGMCLSQQPRLLLLDEPTAGMARADTNNTIDLLKEIKEERDITIAIIEHDMHVVFSLADRITVLAQGTPLVEDVPEKIKGHPKVKEAYLGESA